MGYGLDFDNVIVLDKNAFLKAGRSLFELGEITLEQYTEMLRRAKELGN